MFPTGCACLKGGNVMFYLNAMLTPVKKNYLEEKHRWGAGIDSWWEGKEKGGVEGNLENGPYIPLHTKALSEAADLFATTLIWPQDKTKLGSK